MKYDAMYSCLAKPKKQHSHENWDQVYRAFCMLRNFENIFIGHSGMRIGWTHVEHLLNTCECTWMPMSEYWSPPEHPLSARECQWVSGNTPWTPIECTWPPLSEWEHPLSAHDRLWVIIERDSPWWEHEKVLVHVRNEHALNACECTWMPLSQYWTPPWTLVSARQCQWVSIAHPLNTHWVHMNANEWVGTSPEHPLSAHDRLWVSIWTVWMRTSRVVNLTNL